MAGRPRVKAGGGENAQKDRRAAFVQEYLRNGRNGTQAVIAAGYSPKGASVTAVRLLAQPSIAQQIGTRLAKASEITGLSLERTLLEVARVAYSDPRRYWRPDGSMIPQSEWTEDMAAAVASVEEGPDGAKKLKLWDKNAALDKAMRHLGLYERDNRQQAASYALQVVVVGADQAAPALTRADNAKPVVIDVVDS